MACAKCGESKEPGEFRKKSRTCKVCKHKYDALWYAANREAISRFRAALAGDRRAYDGLRYQANPDKKKAHNAQYYSANRDRFTALVHARRARIRGAVGQFTADQIRELATTQKHKCANPSCCKSIKNGFHRDHMQPLARGGSNDISNIQLLCAACNHRKHAMSYEDWCRETGKLCLAPA